MKVSFLVFLSAVSFSSTSSAVSLFVSESGAGDSCISADPCSSIQQAVDIAKSGDTIHVAAGTYVENIKLGTPQTPNTKPNITIKGAGADETIVVSAGNSSQRPAGIPADIVFDVWSSGVTIEGLTVSHPAGDVIGRDIGVFAGPPANNMILQRCNIVRNRSGEYPAGPGSRGVLVFRAMDTVVSRNTFSGSYEDHIHMPTSASEISRNSVYDATRLGIVIIQETEDSDNSGNTISRNTVDGSGSDGIQVQGDNNEVSRNDVTNNGGAAIKLCGIDKIGDCVMPFDVHSDTTGNTVSRNTFSDNAAAGVVDNGTDNILDRNQF